MPRFTWCQPFVLSLAACAGDPELSESAPHLDVIDQWLPADGAAPIYLVGEEGSFFAPVHATLMPDGNVMFLGIPKGPNYPGTKAALFTPTPLGQTPPAWQVVDTQPIPLEAQDLTIDGWFVDDTPFCGAQTLLADGTLFIAAGTRMISQGVTTYIFGLDYGITFKAGLWTFLADRMKTAGPQGTPIRWYASTTKLSNGKVVVLNGRDYVAKLVNGNFVEIGTENLSADLFDPATSTFSTVSAFGATPQRTFNGDYSHAYVLPYNIPQELLVFGEAGEPFVFSPSNGAWGETFSFRPDTTLGSDGLPTEAPNNGASTAMLPIRVQNGDHGYGNGAVLVAGGTHYRTHERSIDVYDLIFNAWHARQDMGVRRHHPSTVLLPDGNVLVVAGHDDPGTNSDPMIRRAQLVDTYNNFAIANGTSRMGEPRGYHNIALLLPDGRVLIGGGRDAGPDSASNEKPSIRYYYPPYMTRSRPALTYAPPQIGYGQGFYVAHDRKISEAVLVALGSMTHSVDMNQRSVQLQIYAGNDTASLLIGPPEAHVAPPGYYMLFLLDANRTPSIAKIVKVGT